MLMCLEEFQECEMTIIGSNYKLQGGRGQKVKTEESEQVVLAVPGANNWLRQIQHKQAILSAKV